MEHCTDQTVLFSDNLIFAYKYQQVFNHNLVMLVFYYFKKFIF